MYGQLLAAALFLGAAVSAPGGNREAAAMEQQDLFRAGTGGYALYRIPGIVATRNGTLLAYCEARRTGKSDWDSIDLLLRRSTDDGRTWDQPRKPFTVEGPKVKNPVALEKKLAGPDDVTYHNPAAIADRKPGLVHFLFCLEYARCFYARSRDYGRTWSRPVEITSAFDRFRPEYDWKVLAAGPGHGIELRGGRLVVPVWLSTGTGSGGHRPSVTSTIYSDDGGKSWQRGEIAVPNTAEWVDPNETSVVELSDGRVMLNVRSESPAHRRLLTYSRDGAAGWSRPEFHPQLLEPVCMGSMVRLPARRGSRGGILFANPDALESRIPGREARPGESRVRKNLTVKLSRDDGKTWPVSRVLEPGFSGYSDLAASPAGTIFCLYERGSTDARSSTQTGRLSLASFKAEWLQHAASSPPAK